MSNKVKIIQHDEIEAAAISPATCVQWVEESFKLKYEAQLPPKISLHPQGDDFFNTMPVILPPSFGRFSVKIVHRIAGQTPSLGSDILLYDSQKGNLLAIIDGDWITTMRTGAVAALAARMLKKPRVGTYSLMGLGNTGRATALCILAGNENVPVKFRLLRYKDQAESFVQRFEDFSNASFEIIDDVDDFVAGADLLISCITSAHGNICPHDDLYRPGMLLVPVHTRGFQNCDLFFDKVYGDDTGHVEGFKYFSRFKSFDELSRVLLGQNPGRQNDEERILSYNIGLGLHDAVFASKIYDLFQHTDASQCFTQHKSTEKFWI